MPYRIGFADMRPDMTEPTWRYAWWRAHQIFPGCVLYDMGGMKVTRRTPMKDITFRVLVYRNERAYQLSVGGSLACASIEPVLAGE